MDAFCCFQHIVRGTSTRILPISWLLTLGFGGGGGRLDSTTWLVYSRHSFSVTSMDVDKLACSGVAEEESNVFGHVPVVGTLSFMSLFCDHECFVVMFYCGMDG